MKRPWLTVLLASAALSCATGVVGMMGFYDLTSYHGKPIPFDGVRGGELSIMGDGRFQLLTERSDPWNRAALTADTLWGRVFIDGWRGGCTQFVLRFADPSPDLDQRVFAELCEGELALPDFGISFQARR